MTAPHVLPPTYGAGWMTGNARDLVRIAVTFGGFEADELTMRIAKAPSRGENVNSATVERILSEMYAEQYEPGELEAIRAAAAERLRSAVQSHRLNEGATP